jgi:hypothetical protein
MCATDAEFEAQCQCGHRNPEHSLFGSCHGCNDCDDDVDHGDHAYERCQCTEFRLAEEISAESMTLSLTA